MTIDQLIAAERAKITAKLAERKTQQDVIDNVRSTCLTEKRDPTEAEATKVTAAREAKAAIDADLTAIEARIDEYETEKRADAEADRLSRESTPAAARPAYDRAARVGQEERTYRPDQDRHGSMFLRDVAGAFKFGSPDAQSRLARHMQEEQVERGQYLDRAVGTGAFSGLTVPQYLVDEYAPYARAARPFADACNSHPLPGQGMTIDIGRGTTGTSVANQAAENDAASETNYDDTLLSVPVKTAAGQQTMSIQSINRSTGSEDIVLQDLFGAYGTNIDSTLLNEATTGLSAFVDAANTVAYTDATPTAGELWPKFLDAGQRIESALLNVDGPDLLVMHSRRWAWLQSQVGANWPFIAQMNTNARTGGQDLGKEYNSSGYRGNVAGFNVIVDNNIATNLGAGTNEDEVYCVVPRECHLWEDPNAPVFIRAEQAKAANLGVLLVVYGFYAYTFGRYPLATAKIGGTGLVTPTF
jgi:HK97 family phage major capsid protein